MTKEAQPAAVYAPQLSPTERAHLHEVLLDRNLYIHDHQSERPEHLALPVYQRPQLMRMLMHARLKMMRHVATDHLTSLEATLPEQLAVIGHLLDSGMSLIVGDEAFTEHRYKELRASCGDWDPYGLIQTTLSCADAFNAALAPVYGEHALEKQSEPDAWTDAYGYDEACMRANELMKTELIGAVRATEMTATEVARVLLVEGYVNKNNNHSWYFLNAEQAAGDTRAQTRALVAREARAGEAQGRQAQP